MQHSCWSTVPCIWGQFVCVNATLALLIALIMKVAMSLFWDQTASAPAWCSSRSNLLKYCNYNRSHADKWTSAHFFNVSTFYVTFLRICASYIIVVKHIFLLKNLYIMILLDWHQGYWLSQEKLIMYKFLSIDMCLTTIMYETHIGLIEGGRPHRRWKCRRQCADVHLSAWDLS